MTTTFFEKVNAAGIKIGITQRVCTTVTIEICSNIHVSSNNPISSLLSLYSACTGHYKDVVTTDINTMPEPRLDWSDLNVSPDKRHRALTVQLTKRIAQLITFSSL